MTGRFSLYAEYFRSDPADFAIYLIMFVSALLISLILHEVAHGYVALQCGDPTARNFGRLSLRPSHHLDPLGTLCMVLVGIGWARPVPVNPRNFRNGTRDDFLVSIAGICVNLTLFILSCFLSVVIGRFLWNVPFDPTNSFLNPYERGFYLEYWYIKDLIPYMNSPLLGYALRFFLMLGQMNLALAIFNFLPFPPLDGFHVVNDLLLKGRLVLTRQMHTYAHIALLVLVYSGILNSILTVANRFMYTNVLNVFLRILGGA